MSESSSATPPLRFIPRAFEADNWKKVLDGGLTKQGPVSNVANAVRVLQLDPTLGSDILWYDSFLDRIFIARGHAPRPWTAQDDTRLTCYLQDEPIGIRRIPEHIVKKAVRMVAMDRERHCVRDWLLSLSWDGEPRIEHAFEDIWDACLNPDQPCDYVRAASSNFFIGMVARILKPGCQLDTMMVFEGKQGIKKTSALRVLATEPWYQVAHSQVTGKDFFECLVGKWMVEIGEMDAFSRAEKTRVKSVISTPTDYYRKSYGERAEDVQRQQIFGGTTNSDEWGNDDTGLRRFWPLRCGAINIELLAENRAQLFAESVQRFKDGATWWEMPESTAGVQSDRQMRSSWTDLVLTGLVGQSETTVAECLVRILKFDPSAITRTAELTLGSILRLEGWTKKNRRSNGVQRTIWLAPGYDQQIPSAPNLLTLD